MGLVAFSLCNIWFALETSDEEKSLFSSETLENPTLLKAAGVAFLFAVLATELRITNTILDTVNLTVDQWLTAFVVSLAIIVIAEVKKLLKIRTTTVPALATTEAASAAA
jgi:Cation transporting ATPase, C-terminus